MSCDTNNRLKLHNWNILWDEMNSTCQLNWEVLGWNKEIWDCRIGDDMLCLDKPESEAKRWDQLTRDEQEAVENLSYNSSTWDGRPGAPLVLKSDWNNALVQAVEYNGPETTLTWGLQHNICAHAGRSTPGQTTGVNWSTVAGNISAEYSAQPSVTEAGGAADYPKHCGYNRFDLYPVAENCAYGWEPMGGSHSSQLDSRFHGGFTHISGRLGNISDPLPGQATPVELARGDADRFHRHNRPGVAYMCSMSGISGGSYRKNNRGEIFNGRAMPTPVGNANEWPEYLEHPTWRQTFADTTTDAKVAEDWDCTTQVMYGSPQHGGSSPDTARPPPVPTDNLDGQGPAVTRQSRVRLRPGDAVFCSICGKGTEPDPEGSFGYGGAADSETAPPGQAWSSVLGKTKRRGLVRFAPPGHEGDHPFRDHTGCLPCDTREYSPIGIKCLPCNSICYGTSSDGEDCEEVFASHRNQATRDGFECPAGCTYIPYLVSEDRSECYEVTCPDGSRSRSGNGQGTDSNWLPRSRAGPTGEQDCVCAEGYEGSVSYTASGGWQGSCDRVQDTIETEFDMTGDLPMILKTTSTDPSAKEAHVIAVKYIGSTGIPLNWDVQKQICETHSADGLKIPISFPASHLTGGRSQGCEACSEADCALGADGQPVKRGCYLEGEICVGLHNPSDPAGCSRKAVILASGWDDKHCMYSWGEGHARSDYEPDISNQHIVSTMCLTGSDDNAGWAGQTFTYMYGSLVGNASGYMCANDNCMNQVMVTNSAAGIERAVEVQANGGDVTLQPGDYVFCGIDPDNIHHDVDCDGSWVNCQWNGEECSETFNIIRSKMGGGADCEAHNGATRSCVSSEDGCQTAMCNTYNCPDGYKQIDDAANVYCSSDGGVCETNDNNQNSCCVATCAILETAEGMPRYLVDGGDGRRGGDGTPGSSDDFWQDRACPDGQQLKTNANNIECVTSSPSSLTSGTLCDESDCCEEITDVTTETGIVGDLTLNCAGVVCEVSGPCKVAGTCQEEGPHAGQCSAETPADNGTQCTPSDSQTQGNQCYQGRCEVISDDDDTSTNDTSTNVTSTNVTIESSSDSETSFNQWVSVGISCSVVVFLIIGCLCVVALSSY